MKKNKYLVFGILLIFLFFINACKDKEELPPTFQGLLISDSSNPHGQASEIKQDGSLEDWGDIEEKIASEIELGESVVCDYYARPNQTLYLIIKIYNPGGYDLLSCVVNGVRYHSYQFQSPSDYGNIVLAFNSGSEAGKKELKLTAIQYSDGRKIRELTILENNVASYGVLEEGMPFINLTLGNITATSAFITIETEDPKGVVYENGEVFRIFLFYGKDIIYKKDLSLGKNEIKFENLCAAAYYEFVVAAVFDVYDGRGKTIGIFHKETFRTEEIFSFAGLEIGSGHIRFEIQINDEENEGSVEAIELYENGELVASIGADERLFSGLASGTEYVLRVAYRYGTRLAEKFMEVKTHKIKPELEIEITEVSKTFIRYELKQTDPDLICRVTKIELFLNDNLEKTNDPTAEPLFSGLLSGRVYLLKATYAFDLEDGFGERTASVVATVGTEALAIPEIAIENFTAGPDRFDFGIHVTDPDATGELTAAVLYEGEEPVQEVKEFPETVSFLGLKENTVYRIAIRYAYDLNDGQGVRELESVSERATLPLPVNITDLVFLTQNLPRVGEEIHSRLLFDNPSRAEILSCTVNGEEVPVALGKDKDTGIIVIRPVTEGGIYEIEITNVKYAHFGAEISQELQERFTSEILILGDFDVLGIYAEEGRIGVEDSGYLYVDLRNETGFLVSEVVLKFQGKNIVYQSEEIEAVNNNLLALPWKEEVNDFSAIYKKITLAEITYGISGIETTKLAVSGIETEIMILRTLVPRLLYTYEDLVDLEDGYIYRLENDIDLARTVWEPLAFSGILDGGGHSLRNLAVVRTVSGNSGLFSEFSGEIMNLELVDFYISVRADASAVGALCGRAGRVKIADCNLYGIIDVFGTGEIVGGLIGEADAAEVKACQLKIDLRVTSSGGKLAGIAGFAGKAKLTGNLISGNITVLGNAEREAFVNGAEKDLKNNYLAFDFYFEENGAERKFPQHLYIGLEELDDPEFYRATLGWSESVWDFSLLDYERGLTPVLVK